MLRVIRSDEPLPGDVRVLVTSAEGTVIALLDPSADVSEVMMGLTAIGGVNEYARQT